MKFNISVLGYNLDITLSNPATSRFLDLLINVLGIQAQVKVTKTVKE